jgi:hypothetical protein
MAPQNLPRPLTRFIGREREMVEITRLLGERRLLTLTGTGGCGKTRLAVQVAHTVSGAFKDGIWLVQLASLHDPALVPQLLAQTLGWQQVNISFRRSSGIESSISGSSWVASASRIAPLRSSVAARRRRSMARRLAIVNNQAPGLRGTPSSTQRSRALTSASCNESSARSKSSNWLINAARTRPCSWRKIFSTCSAAVIRSPI